MSGAPRDAAASPQDAARAVFRGATDRESTGRAVVRFHRQVDAILGESHRVHRVEVACRRGCAHCCHLQVHVLPPEAFALADWLRRHRTPAQVERIATRLRENARLTVEMGEDARRKANLPCALLDEQGACGAYEARPASCRRFHSTDVATCKASFDAPGDDRIAAAAHPLVAHNADVVVTLARHGLRDAGLDDQPRDMNLALLSALEESKAWRRWRDGKKLLASLARAWALVWPVAATFGLVLDED